MDRKPDIVAAVTAPAVVAAAPAVAAAAPAPTVKTCTEDTWSGNALSHNNSFHLKPEPIAEDSQQPIDLAAVPHPAVPHPAVAAAAPVPAVKTCPEDTWSGNALSHNNSFHLKPESITEEAQQPMVTILDLATLFSSIKKEPKLEIQPGVEYVEECGVSPPILPHGAVTIIADEENDLWRPRTSFWPKCHFSDDSDVKPSVGRVIDEVSPPSSQAIEKNGPEVVIDNAEEDDHEESISLFVVESGGPGSCIQGRVEDDVVLPSSTRCRANANVRKEKRRSDKGNRVGGVSAGAPERRRKGAPAAASTRKSRRRSSRQESVEDSVVVSTDQRLAAGSPETIVVSQGAASPATSERPPSVNLLLEDSDAELYADCSLSRFEEQEADNNIQRLSSGRESPHAVESGRASVESLSLFEEESDLECGPPPLAPLPIEGNFKFSIIYLLLYF